jgi:hypothetical protein
MKKFAKNSTIFSLSFLLCTTLFYGCSKDRIEEDDKLNEYSSVNTYLDSKKQEEQEFIIDSSGTGPIIGNQGTKIWMGKECLMFPNGDSVAWPFTVKLVELYTPKDMIYYQMPNVASGNILETDGEIRLRAFKNGTELALKPNPCLSIIEMPNPAPKNYMHVYYGFETAGYPDWTDNVASLGVTSSLTPAFSTTATSYLDSIAKLGWVNCGFQVGNGSGSILTFTSTTDELKNVGIFIYFPATKTVMQVYNTVSGLIPNGSNVKIVMIAINSGGQLYSFYQSQAVNSSASIKVTLSATTDAALTALLDGL